MNDPKLSEATDSELLDEAEARACLPAEKSISDFSNDEIHREYAIRFGNTPADDLTQIYEVFRSRGDAPECLRRHLYDCIGRILP